MDDPSKSGSQMRGKRPLQALVTQPIIKRPAQGFSPSRGTMESPRGQDEVADETNQQQSEEKITVAINPSLLQCCVCFGPLTPPLFQCTKGHILCSGCCTVASPEEGEGECLMCREPETVTRCRAVEQVLAGLIVPCPFREHGCAEMIPYVSKQAHSAACAHAPCHCPIAGCAGYFAGGSRSLREHIRQDHPGVHRMRVTPGCLTPLRLRAHEQARLVRLAGAGGGEFLVVVGQYKQVGRALSLVLLVDDEEPVPAAMADFKNRVEMAGQAGVVSLSGHARGVKRLAEPYKPNPFLFVPNETWESREDVPVFIQLKSS